MALQTQHCRPGIGCSSILARARVQCLAAASHMRCLPVLLHINGSEKAQFLSHKVGSNEISLRRRRRRDLGVVVAEASAAANVTSPSPRSISVSDVLWPSAGESESWCSLVLAWSLLIFLLPLLVISERCCWFPPCDILC